MKKLLGLILALVLAPVVALGQTATPTSTATYAPFVVGLAGFNLTASSDTPRHQLGIPYYGKEGIFVYAKATETIGDGQWVFLSSDNTLTLADIMEGATTGKPQRVCVAAADATTSSPYLWVWCGGGTFNALVTNAVAAGVYLTTTLVPGTAGTTGQAIGECVTVQAGVTDTRTWVRCPREAVLYFVPPTPAATPTSTPTP